MGDCSDVKARLSVFAQDDGGEDTLHALTDIVTVYAKTAADAMASTTTANTSFWMNPYDFAVKVVSACILPQSTLTADPSNYATITVKTDDGAAGTPAVAVQWDTTTTGTGSWATSVKEAGTVTAANTNVAVGACLHFNIAKTGTGVVVPACIIMVRLRKV